MGFSSHEVKPVFFPIFKIWNSSESFSKLFSLSENFIFLISQILLANVW